MEPKVGSSKMPVPSLVEEVALGGAGYRFIAGIDEVGRGPLAGPLVAAAVILPPEPAAWFAEVRDSKLLTHKQRRRLRDAIVAEALAWGIGLVPPDIVDSEGLTVATRCAMAEAISRLACAPDHLLIDAFPLPNVALPQRCIIDGDALCLSIAAASIVAKVHRDELMDGMDALYPGYGFCHNKGYYTEEHVQALNALGPCPIHRRSFAPVREALERSGKP